MATKIRRRQSIDLDDVLSSTDCGNPRNQGIKEWFYVPLGDAFTKAYSARGGQVIVQIRVEKESIANTMF
jgi:hypothetical protein